MTARERVERTLNFQEPDRVPIVDIMHNRGTIAYYAGVKKEQNLTLKEVARAVGSSLDMALGVAPPEIRRIEDRSGFKYRIEDWTAWLVKRPFNDAKGLASYIEKNIKEVERSDPETIWTYAGSSGLWTSGKGSYRDQFLELQDLVGDTVLMHTESPIGLDVCYYLAGWELFSYLYYDDPDLISTWFETLNRHEIERVHHVADKELSPVALIYSDIAHTGGTMFSPEFLKKEFYPRVKNLSQAWHEHDIKVIFHSEGCLMDVLDDLVATGIDGLNPLEPLSKMDLRTIRKKYPRLILWGGIDNTQLLPFGKVEEVEAAVRRAIDDCAAGGGYLLGSSGELHPGCKPENCIAMIEAARRYGK